MSCEPSSPSWRGARDLLRTTITQSTKGVIVMVQQGQVLQMKSTAADGSALWGYRYRVGGRDSRRVQRSGFRSERDATEALERAIERLRTRSTGPRDLWRQARRETSRWQSSAPVRASSAPHGRRPICARSCRPSARASKTESLWSRAQRAFTPERRLRDSKDAAALASILEARLQCTVREAA